MLTHLPLSYHHNPSSVPGSFFSVDSQFKLRISLSIQKSNRLHMYEVCCFNHYEVCLLPPSTAPQGTHRPASHCSLHTNIPLSTLASGISGVFALGFLGGCFVSHLQLLCNVLLHCFTIVDFHSDDDYIQCNRCNFLCIFC